MSKITHNTYINKLHQILQGHVQQLIQVHATVSKLLESSLLLLVYVCSNVISLLHR